MSELTLAIFVTVAIGSMPLLIVWLVFSTRQPGTPPIKQSTKEYMAAFIRTVKRLTWANSGRHFALPSIFLVAATLGEVFGDGKWYMWLAIGILTERGWRDFKNSFDADKES